MRSSRSVLAGALVAGLLSGLVGPAGLGLPAVVAAAAPTAPAAEPEPDLRFASDAATNPPVRLDEVVSARSAQSRTWATETPGVLQTEISTGPINYQVGGQWLPIDTSLVSAPAGGLLAEKNSFATQLAPIATAGELVHLGLGEDLSVGYSLSGALPVPVVPDVSDASSASYKSVLPGVDLKVRVLGTGVKEELVLAGPSAPKTYTFPLTTQGLTPREAVAGIEFVDTAGEVLVTMPHGWMRDSKIDPGSGEGAFSDGAKLSLTEVGGKPAVKLTLDAAWLSDPAREFPVTVDPTSNVDTIVTGADDTYVQQTYNMDFSTEVDLKAGTWDGGATPARSFMHFPLGQIMGQTVTNADLHLYENWSYSCTARELQVRRVLDPWNGSSARWDGPGLGSLDIASPSFAYGHDSGCPARDVAMDVTVAAQNWADSTWANYGLGIRASETDNYAWKRFNSYNDGANRPRLVVTWSDTTPPTIGTVSSSTHPTQSNWYSRNDITVSWTATDGTGSGVDGYSWALDQNSATVPDTVKNAEEATKTASFTDKADGVWWFHVRAKDIAGNWGPADHFKVQIDTTAPAAVTNLRATDGRIVYLNNLDDTIEIAWDASADAKSGIGGYSVAFNQNKDTAADGSIDTTGLTATSAQLADGLWYAHIRAIDKAVTTSTTTDGNLATDTVVGPFVVGTATLAELLFPDPVAQSTELGLEQSQPFSATDTGAGSAYVQLRTGNLVTQQDLATVPGQGLNAVLRLTHNSQAAGRETGYGKGWTLSVADVEGTVEGALDGLTDGSVTDLDVTSDVVLSEILTDPVTGLKTLTQEASYTKADLTGDVLEFTDGDGTTHRFVRSAGQGSRWDAPPGVDLQLREVEKEIVNAAGATVKIVDRFELIRPDGVMYTVTRQDQALGLPLPLWRVSKITDRNGNTLSFTHANKGPAGINQSRLTEIKMSGPGKAAEVVARFTYITGTLTTPARLDYLQTMPDLAGSSRKIDLTHDAAGHLTKVDQNSHLASGAADRRAVLYTYNADDTLSSVSEGLPDTATVATASQKTTFAYLVNKIEPSERKTLPRLITLTDRAGKAWSWTYAAKAGTTSGERTTTATRPFSGATTRTTTYEFSGRAPVNDSDDPRIAGGNVTSITDAGTDAGPVTSTYDWYANKLIASLDGLGNKTSFTYNGLGLLTSVTAPPPNRPGQSGLPAGAVADPVTSRLTYSFPTGFAPTTCAAPAYGSGKPVTSDGLCAGAVAELTRMIAADSVDAQQRVADFTYDSTGNITVMTERANADGSANAAGDRTSRFKYYANGALAKMDGPRTDVVDVTCYGWAATNASDCSTSGAPADGGYDATGLPKVVEDALGKTRTFIYDRYGMKTKVTDRDGAVVTSAYDALNNLISATAPGSKTTSYGYDRNGNKTSETSPGTATTSWVYGATDLLDSMTTPGAITTGYTYFDDGSTKSVDGPLTGTADSTTYAYFPNGSVQTVTAPAGTGQTAVTSYAYDSAGRQIRSVQPIANTAGDRSVIELTLTPAGGVQVNATTASTGAAGNTDRKVTTYFNAHGEPITQTGPRTVGGVLQRTDTTYDTFGQATQVARTLTATKKINYLTGYDLAGNQISSSQPTGNGAKLESKFKFDALNRLLEQYVDPVNPGHRVSYEYTGEGQQSRRIDWKQDALGDAAKPCSDLLALCTKQRQVDTTFNADNSQASMVYTDLTVGTGDAERIKATCNYADGQPTSSGYDSEGNLLVTRTVAGPQPAAGASICDTGTLWREQTFAYNTRNLISSSVQKVRSPGSGNLISRTQTFTYHADGTRASLTQSDGTNNYTTNYASSPAGWNESVTDWRGKTSTTSYLPIGGVDAVSLGNSRATATLGYNNDGSLADFTWKAQPGTDPAVTVREHSGISYDVGGLRTGETVKVRNPEASTLVGAAANYSHDALDRLTGYTSPFAYKTGAGATASDAKQPAVAYTLDDGGNITAEVTTVDGLERRNVANTYGTGRLTKTVDRTIDGLNIAQTTTTLTYDALGEETKRSMKTDLPALSNVTSTTDTSYDPAGHTDAATNTANLGAGAPADDVEKANTDVDYRYDTTDRVITRTETKPSKPAEHTLIFYLGGTGAIAEETDGQGDTKARYLLDADGETLGQQTYKVTAGDADGTGEKWTWLLNDALGNTATLIADDGSVVEQKAYDPYGGELQGGSKRTTDTAAPKTTLGFQGARTDETTGKVMLGARQYDPTAGRFVSPDTFVAGALDLQLGADALTGNRYLFAGGMPTSFYEDGHGFGSWLKDKVKKVAPVLEYVPVVSTAVDVVNAATGRNWYEGGRPMSGAERLMALGTSVLGVVPGGGLAKAGTKAALKGLDKAQSLRKITKATSCMIEGANSFTLDTPVLMADGTTRPIGELEVGDWVWSTDPVTGEAGPAPISVVIEGEGAKTLVEITTEDGQTLIATDGHPVFVVNENGYVAATDLRPGDLLLEADGDHVRIASVGAWHVGYERVRNLTVAGFHTYHVGSDRDGVLVHNQGCGDAADAAGRLARNGDIGKRAEHELADALRASGAEVEQQRYFKTPLGKRFIDIDVKRDGVELGGIEVKVGGSRYKSSQRAKDWYINRKYGYGVTLVRLSRMQRGWWFWR